MRGGPDQSDGAVAAPSSELQLSDAGVSLVSRGQAELSVNESAPVQPSLASAGASAGCAPRVNTSATLEEDEPCAVCFEEFEGEHAVKQLPCGEFCATGLTRAGSCVIMAFTCVFNRGAWNRTSPSPSRSPNISLLPSYRRALLPPRLRGQLAARRGLLPRLQDRRLAAAVPRRPRWPRARPGAADGCAPGHGRNRRPSLVSQDIQRSSRKTDRACWRAAPRRQRSDRCAPVSFCRDRAGILRHWAPAAAVAARLHAGGAAIVGHRHVASFLRRCIQTNQTANRRFVTAHAAKWFVRPSLLWPPLLP